MKLNKRKGFTIVELVIVIAVIAILAAVLIPNISNLVKKANASADESLVRNLNTALSMDVEKHLTMDAALEAALKNGGYELTTIVTKNKDNKILWDSKNDCFVYMKKGASKPTYLPNTQEVKDVAPYDYFEILNELPADGKIPDSQTYSVYLAGNAYTGTVETPVGFDAGKNAVSKVTFKTAEKRSVLINTNGGEFEVEAEQASVEHRGEATIVTIKAVYDESYHENGKVNEIKLEKGRVVVEAKAEVGSILVTAAAATGVKVEVKDSATLGAIGAKNFDISNETGIITGADKTQVVTGSVNNSDFAGGFGTEKAPYLIANETHLCNIGKKSTSYSYFKQLNNIVISDAVDVIKLNGIYDGGNYVISANASKKDVIVIFQEVKDATVQNLTITSSENCLITPIESYQSNSKITLRNITANSLDNKVIKINQSNAAFLINGHTSTGNTILIENCIINASLENTGDCTGVFVGGGLNWDGTNKTTLTIKNSVYTGTIKGNSQAGFIYGNGCHATKATLDQAKALITLDNVTNNGTISAVKQEGGVVSITNGKELSDFYKSSVGGNYTKGDNVLAGKDLTVTLKDGKFVISGADYNSDYVYKLNVKVVEVKIDLTYVFNGRGLLLPLVNDEAGETVDWSKGHHAYDAKLATEKGITVSNFDYLFENTYNAAVVIKDGIVYVVFDNSNSAYPKCDSNLKFSIVAYDKTGSQVGFYDLK